MMTMMKMLEPHHAHNYATFLCFLWEVAAVMKTYLKTRSSKLRHAQELVPLLQVRLICDNWSE